MELMYSEDEVRAAGEQARESGVWLTGHAHAAEALKMGVRNGFRVLYHCTYGIHPCGSVSFKNRLSRNPMAIAPIGSHNK